MLERLTDFELLKASWCAHILQIKAEGEAMAHWQVHDQQNTVESVAEFALLKAAQHAHVLHIKVEGRPCERD